ncbi:MAG: cell wall metabolism sensor histidine kinase WalK [Chloroflexi bacterium]|nr:cell wall metabolism sensor histidine kinase WalK [Chloroflexota bacterium]
MAASTVPSKPQTETSNESRRGPLFVSLRVKLLVVFILLYAVIFGGVYYWFYEFATDAVMDRLQEDLETLMEGVSGQIDGDEFALMVEQAGEPTEDGYYPDVNEDGTYPDEVSRIYWEQAAFLNQMKHIDPRARFYTYVRGSEPNEVIWIGSSSALDDPPSGATFMNSDVYGPADAAILYEGLEDKKFLLDIYDDPNFPGGWISGYIPIRDSNDQVVGALGVDFVASYVREVQDNVKDGLYVAAGITALLITVMVFLMAELLSRPVTALTKAADRIGEGDYDQDLSHLTPGRFSDEIGKLAEVFEIMVGKVATREQKLKQQVVELQIMIDESKRQEQVEEIVDTDFFRDLQSKARAMREGMQKREVGTQASEQSASGGDSETGSDTE